MPEGKKSVFTRPEQTGRPAIGPDAERFVHGPNPASPPAEETRAETPPTPEPATGDQAKETSTEPEPMKRLTIDIPLSLHKRVKSQCANRGTTIAEVVRKYLEKTFPDQERRKGS